MIHKHLKREGTPKKHRILGGAAAALLLTGMTSIASCAGGGQTERYARCADCHVTATASESETYRVFVRNDIAPESGPPRGSVIYEQFM